MRFNSQRAYERYRECLSFAYEHRLAANLHEVFARLLSWESYDEREQQSEVVIGMDWDDKSFSFSVHNPDGTIGICGGIIYHGCPADGYLENGSVMLSPSYGWQIHT